MPWLAIAGLGLAAAQTGVSAAGAAGAFDSSSGGGVTTIPQSPRSRAIQHLLSRALVQNLGAVSPSFGEYTESGGKATFPFKFELTPKEATQLGLFTKTGKAIPFVDPMSKTLSTEQLLFLAQQEAATQGSESPLRRLGQLETRIEHRTLRGKPTEKLVEKRKKIIDRLPTIGPKNEEIFSVDQLNAYLNTIDEQGRVPGRGI